MSDEKSTLDAMLEQYEAATTSRKETTFDLKNYFTTYLEDGIDNKIMSVRVLPINGSPFIPVHVHSTKLEGKNRKFVCPSHMKDEACPFCETREKLLSTGEKSDEDLAKNYRARKMYIVKVIDRLKEDEGPKFWRFPDNYKKDGIYDKIIAIVKMLKQASPNTADITNPETGRDLALNVVRVKNPRGGTYPTVNTIIAGDPSKLSEDAEQSAAWINDEKKWDSVYAVKNHNYLEIIVKGQVPAWSKKLEKFVSKDSLASATDENVTDDLDAELTIGKGNVVEDVKPEELVTESALSADASKPLGDDDLPF